MRPGETEGDEQDQQTPLHLAALFGHLPVVEYLVEEHKVAFRRDALRR